MLSKSSAWFLGGKPKCWPWEESSSFGMFMNIVVSQCVSMCFLGFRVVFFNHELQFFLMCKPPPLNQTIKTLVYVPYNTHCRTLTNLQSEKSAQSWQFVKENYKSIHKNMHLWMAKPAPHTWVFFLGQASMHIYSSWYPLAHTIIPKGTQFFYKNPHTWNYPLHRS